LTILYNAHVIDITLNHVKDVVHSGLSLWFFVLLYGEIQSLGLGASTVPLITSVSQSAVECLFAEFCAVFFCSYLLILYFLCCLLYISVVDFNF